MSPYSHNVIIIILYIPLARDAKEGKAYKYKSLNHDLCKLLNAEKSQTCVCGELATWNLHREVIVYS